MMLTFRPVKGQKNPGNFPGAERVLGPGPFASPRPTDGSPPMTDPTTLIALAVAMLGVGAISGTIAGLLGVGGGIVIVPVLFHVLTGFGIDGTVRMHLAVGTSLATIIPTSIVSGLSHHKRGGVDPDLLRSWGPWVFIGALVGTALAGWAKGQVLTAVFATVALLVAVRMAFSAESVRVADHLPSGVPKAGLAGLVGAFSAMMGIGGGTLSVPVLSAFGYPIRRAVGTAAAIGLIISVPGTIGFVIAGWTVPGLPPYSVGYVNLVAFALIAPTTMLMAPWGAYLAHTMKTGWLRLAFAGFLALTSLRMYLGLWNGI